MDWDFGQNQTVASLDKVPADFRGLYKQEGEQFKLDSDHPGVKSAVSVITGLNRALVASRAEAKGYKDKAVDLSPLADYGSDPATILEGFTTKLKDAGKGKGEDVTTAVAKAKDAMAQEHARQLKARDERETKLTGQLHKVLVGQAATAALAEADAVDVDLAMPHVVANVRAVQLDSGEVGVVVIDQTGQPRYSGVTGQHMNIKELVAEMRGQDKFAPLFKSKTPSGGGGQPTRRPVQGGSGEDTRTGTDKIAAAVKVRRR